MVYLGTFGFLSVSFFPSNILNLYYHSKITAQAWDVLVVEGRSAGSIPSTEVNNKEKEQKEKKRLYNDIQYFKSRRIFILKYALLG